MLDARFSALIKVDLDVVAKCALEVELLHGGASFVRRCVRHSCLAETHFLTHLVEAHGELAGLNSAILAADGL